MVRPKKHLGQHFLKDRGIAGRTADALIGHGDYKRLIEIGPGTGVLTSFLLNRNYTLTLIEIDSESVHYLRRTDQYAGLDIREQDFLRIELPLFDGDPFGIIGNFPYNISSQIFFRILDMHNQVMEVVCMLQKEVAQRLASGPGNKQYGILSVLLQAYYDIEYLFTVPPAVFHPPPKVDSAVIRLKRNDTLALDCNEQLFRKIVKQGFQNRRKTLRNALKPLNLDGIEQNFDKILLRAEQLDVQDFERLTKLAETHGTHY